MNHALSFFERGMDSGILITSHDAHNVSASPFMATFSCVPASFGLPYTSMPLLEKASVVAAKPFDACSSLENASNKVNGSAVLVSRGGGCTFQVSIIIVIVKDLKFTPKLNASI